MVLSKPSTLPPRCSSISPASSRNVRLPCPRTPHGRRRRIQDDGFHLHEDGRDAPDQRSQEQSIEQQGEAQAQNRATHGTVHDLCWWPAAILLGDAAEYAAYVLNWNAPKANPKRTSPLEVLTSQAPDFPGSSHSDPYARSTEIREKKSPQPRAQLGHIVGMKGRD